MSLLLLTEPEANTLEKGSSSSLSCYSSERLSVPAAPTNLSDSSIQLCGTMSDFSEIYPFHPEIGLVSCNSLSWLCPSKTGLSCLEISFYTLFVLQATDLVALVCS